MMDRDPIEDALRRPAPDEPSSLSPLILDRSAVAPVRRTTGPRTSGRRLRLASALAVITTAFVVVVTLQFGSISHSVGTPEPSARATATATGVSTPSPSLVGGSLLHFSGDGVSFDYPSAWHLYPARQAFTMGSSLAIVGTADLSACPTQGLSIDVNCAYSAKLAPGDIAVFVGTGANPAGSILDFAPPGGFKEYIDGMPAAATTNGPLAVTGQEEGRAWTIGMPGVLDNWYVIRAAMRGPGIDKLRQQADALARSLRFDHPAPTLPTDAASMASALSKGIDAMDRDARESSHSKMYACFSRTPDSSAQATIEDGPGGPLAGPLVVTCSVSIKATVIGQWEVTLSVGWAAGPGYAAGVFRQLLYLDAGGALGSLRSLTDTSFPATRPDVTPGPATTPVVLAPGSLVEVLPPGLTLYLTPDGTGDTLSSLPRGDRLWIVDGPRQVNGAAWYRVQWQPTPTYDGIPAWIPALVDGHPIVAPVGPRCPSPVADVVDLLDLHPAERLLCFADRPITLGPVMLADGTNATSQATGSPAWLADSAKVRMFGREGPEGVDGALLVRAAPDATISGQARTLPMGTWLEVTGHFDDPASATCQRSWAPEENGSISPETPAEQVFECREQFVITSARPVPAP